MSIRFWWGSGSGPAWRVHLALLAKKLPFESNLLSFDKREHRTDAMVAMNPRGKVPVLRDGDYVVYESLAILYYLDRRYPDPPLFGRTPEEGGLIVRTIMEHECYGGPALASATRPLLRGPDVDLEAVTEALPRLREELARVESQLAGREWLAGASMTAADLFVYPAVKTIERAFGKPAAGAIEHGLLPLASSYPFVGRWMERVESLEGFERSYPPHWRDAPVTR